MSGPIAKLGLTESSRYTAQINLRGEAIEMIYVKMKMPDMLMLHYHSTKPGESCGEYVIQPADQSPLIAELAMGIADEDWSDFAIVCEGKYTILLDEEIALYKWPTVEGAH